MHVPIPQPDPVMGTLSAAGRRYGCSIDTIERFIDAGLLPVYRFGTRGHRRVKYTDVERLLTRVANTGIEVEPDEAASA